MSTGMGKNITMGPDMKRDSCAERRPGQNLATNSASRNLMSAPCGDCRAANWRARSRHIFHSACNSLLLDWVKNLLWPPCGCFLFRHMCLQTGRHLDLDLQPTGAASDRCQKHGNNCCVLPIATESVPLSKITSPSSLNYRDTLPPSQSQLHTQ